MYLHVTFILQAKDLTSSLLTNMTSLNNMSLNSSSRTAPMQTSGGFSTTPTMGGMGTMPQMSNGFNSPMTFQTGGLGMSMRPTAPGLYGGMSSTNSAPNFAALTQNQNQPNKPPDMSSLDSLFPANKPKVSLNQIPSKPAVGAGVAPSLWINQFNSAQSSQTAPMQALPMGMSGVQGGFGVQANPFFSPQNFSQPAPAPAVKQSMSVSNDLKDLFG